MLFLSGIELGWTHDCTIQKAIDTWCDTTFYVWIGHAEVQYMMHAASDEKGIRMHETMMAIRGPKQNGNKTTLREKRLTELEIFHNNDAFGQLTSV